MYQKLFRPSYCKQLITYFSLFCLLSSSLARADFLTDDEAVFVDEAALRRTRIAYILAGVTVIGLGVGIGYAAAGSDGNCHHHSSHSNSYSSSSHHSNHHHHHHHNHHHDHHSDYSYSSFSDLAFNPNDQTSVSHHSSVSLGPQFEARSRTLKGMKKKSKNDSLAGSFNSNVVGNGQGSFTVFVQLPDGTTQHLGQLSFSSYQNASLNYGPFHQKGTYTFGIKLDEASDFSNQTKIGSVNIELNGATVQHGDFSVPAHVNSHYEPSTCSYVLE